MDLVINNKVINEPIENILKRLKFEIDSPYLREIGKPKKGNISITCPFHKDGQETKPSATIRRTEGQNTYIGNFHCFTCR